MVPIMIPITLYSLENARQEMETRTGHKYDIAIVRKAIRENKLRSIRVDDRTVVVTLEAIEEYLRKYSRFSRRKHD
jgi:hypothetical protein